MIKVTFMLLEKDPTQFNMYLKECLIKELSQFARSIEDFYNNAVPEAKEVKGV